MRLVFILVVILERKKNVFSLESLFCDSMLIGETPLSVEILMIDDVHHKTHALLSMV